MASAITCGRHNDGPRVRRGYPVAQPAVIVNGAVVQNGFLPVVRPGQGAVDSPRAVVMRATTSGAFRLWTEWYRPLRSRLNSGRQTTSRAVAKRSVSSTREVSLTG